MSRWNFKCIVEDLKRKEYMGQGRGTSQGDRMIASPNHLFGWEPNSTTRCSGVRDLGIKNTSNQTQTKKADKIIWLLTQERVEAKICGFDFSEVLLNNFSNSITPPKYVKIAIFASVVSILVFFCNYLNIFSPTVLFWPGFDAAARLCLVLADESNIVVRQ